MDRVAEALVRVDALCERMDALIEQRTGSQTQTVIHKTEGMSGWNIAAVCACFFTCLMLIITLIVIIPDMHDLRAWRDIHSAKIARLEAAQEHK